MSQKNEIDALKQANENLEALLKAYKSEIKQKTDEIAENKLALAAKEADVHKKSQAAILLII